MDPNTALEELRELAARELIGETGETQRDLEFTRLAELVSELDRWIAKGGFLPDAWKN